MRNTLGLILLGAIAAVTLVSVLGAQDAPTSSGVRPPDASHIWNFHFEGKKKRGDVIELVQLDDPKHSAKTLVITHLELRLSQSMRVELETFFPDPEKKRDGKPMWAKKLVRGVGLNAGVLDSTSDWIMSNYDSNTGIVFAPMTRPSVEVTFGSGEMEIWAEGYWATP